ncbi:unnamed protein product [Colias eurytheme]|nr:unnamed protein product [Colias eurytheme]
MESIAQSMEQMVETFNHRMDDFQKDLQAISAAPMGSPSSKLASDFTVFRTFVLTSLQCLQSEVVLLNKLVDQQEMQTRKKILLIHGVKEDKNEKVDSTVAGILTEHLNIPDASITSFSRCHRMGRSNNDRPRPIVVKFKDISLKHKIWSAKKDLKGSGITLSEFLTKPRHDVFMAARKRFGVERCWTRDGNIFLIGPDGNRHQINALADLDDVPVSDSASNRPVHKAPTASSGFQPKDKLPPRSKRVIKK